MYTKIDHNFMKKMLLHFNVNKSYTIKLIAQVFISINF